MPNFVVVTVNYCCADAILEGLGETVAQVRALGDAEFWIVDNASPDQSATVLEKAIQDMSCGDVVKVIRSEVNAGFGAGNNVAIHAALALPTPPDYLYFLNPDAIPEPGALKALLEALEVRPNAGVVGSLLRNELGETEASFFRFPSFLSEVEKAISFGPLRRLLRKHVVVLDTPDHVQAVDWVSGASFIARTSALAQAGTFDEAFFLYWEEVELCHRIKAAGFEIYAVPDAVVMHVGGVSTGVDPAKRRTPAFWFQSRKYFFQTTGVAGNVTILNLVVSFGLVLQRLHLGVRGKAFPSPHFLKDFVRHNFSK